MVETPAAGKARLPYLLTGEFTLQVHDGIRAFYGQPEHPDPAHGPAVLHDEGKLIPPLARQGGDPAAGPHVPDGVLGDLQAPRGVRLILIQPTVKSTMTAPNATTPTTRPVEVRVPVTSLDNVTAKATAIKAKTILPGRASGRGQ